MLSSYSTNHTDIMDDSDRSTAAGVARRCGHYALADYVEGFQQPGPRGELAISYSVYTVDIYSELHGLYSYK